MQVPGDAYLHLDGRGYQAVVCFVIEMTPIFSMPCCDELAL
jgi:hypothetical protein